MKIYIVFNKTEDIISVHKTEAGAQLKIEELAQEEFRKAALWFVELLEKDDGFTKMWQPDIQRTRDDYSYDEYDLEK